MNKLEKWQLNRKKEKNKKAKILQNWNKIHINQI